MTRYIRAALLTLLVAAIIGTVIYGSGHADTFWQKILFVLAVWFQAAVLFALAIGRAIGIADKRDKEHHRQSMSRQIDDLINRILGRDKPPDDTDTHDQ